MQNTMTALIIPFTSATEFKPLLRRNPKANSGMAIAYSSRHRVSSHAFIHSMLVTPYVFKENFFQGHRILFDGGPGYGSGLFNKFSDIPARQYRHGSPVLLHVLDAIGPSHRRV